MEVKINNREVKAVLSYESNTNANDSALTLIIDGWSIIEISNKGKLRRCTGIGDSSLFSLIEGGCPRCRGKIKLEEGNF